MEQINKEHDVKHLFSGKSNFYEVESYNSGKIYNVSLQLRCDCGGPLNPHNNTTIKAKGLCSHIEQVLKDIITNKSVRLIMSPEYKQRRINECLNLVRSSNREINIVRSSEGEGEIHRAKKEEICKQLEIDDHQYICEPIFEQGGRADILVLDQFKIIEISVTETEKSLKEKEKYYPNGLDIEVIRC